MENKYVKMLMQNLSHVIMAVLVLLLGVVYWFSQQEKNKQPPETQAPVVATPNPLLPDERLAMVQSKLAALPPVDQTDVGAVRKFDMFDLQQVADSATREQQANALFETAKAAEAAGRPDEALKTIEEIFRIFPPHIQAKELRNKILKDMAKPPEATPDASAGAAIAPTAAAPTATPAA